MDNQSTQYRPITVGDWFLTILISAIPIINIIMLFVWGFGSSTHPSKANWAKAMLIWLVIAILFYFLIFVAILDFFSLISK